MTVTQEELLSDALTTLQYLVQLLSQGSKLEIEATLPNGVKVKLNFSTNAAEPKKVVRRRRAKAAAVEPAE